MTLVHLGSVGLPVGTAVGEGEVVGTIGPSGEPEGPEPYVHLGIRLTADPNGYLDPLSLLPGQAAGVRASAGERASASARSSCFGAGADRVAADGGRGPAAAPSNVGVELEDTRPRPTAHDAANAASEPPGRGPSTRQLRPQVAVPRRVVAPRASVPGPRSHVHATAPTGSRESSERASRVWRTCGAADDRRSRAAGPEDDSARAPSTHRRVASRRGVCGSACGFLPRFQAAVPAHGGAEACPYH